MDAVAFWLTRQHPAAFVAGVIFAFAPNRMDHYREFQMEMAFGIPLALYALVRFLDTQRMRYLVALLVAFALQTASVWYEYACAYVNRRAPRRCADGQNRSMNSVKGDSHGRRSWARGLASPHASRASPC